MRQDYTVVSAFVGRDLAVSAAGETFVAGEFAGQIDFDPGPAKLVLGGPSLTDYGTFVVKLGVDGRLDWARDLPESTGVRLVLDNQGRAIIAGPLEALAFLQTGLPEFLPLAPPPDYPLLIGLDDDGHVASVRALDVPFDTIESLAQLRRPACGHRALFQPAHDWGLRLAVAELDPYFHFGPRQCLRRIGRPAGRPSTGAGRSPFSRQRYWRQQFGSSHLGKGADVRRTRCLSRPARGAFPVARLARRSLCKLHEGCHARRLRSDHRPQPVSGTEYLRDQLLAARVDPVNGAGRFLPAPLVVQWDTIAPELPGTPFVFLSSVRPIPLRPVQRCRVSAVSWATRSSSSTPMAASWRGRPSNRYPARVHFLG